MTLMRTGRLAMLLAVILWITAGCGQQVNPTEPPSGGKTGTPDASTQAPSGTDASKPPAGSTSTPGGNKGTPAAGSEQTAKGVMGQVKASRIIDASAGWVGGDGWIARSDDGGKQWKVQYQGEETVDQLFALNGKEAWAVFAQQQGKTNERRLLQTTDGGAHWAPVGKVPDGDFLHFLSPGEAFMANSHSTDGGKTWTALPVPAHLVGSAYFHDAHQGWAVTWNAPNIQVQKTEDGGATWKPVMTRKSAVQPNGAVIRSGGKDDVWIVFIGDSGMSQTSYSLLHSADSGATWRTVLANSTAGAGPAPGVSDAEKNVAKNAGSKPGALYVVNSKVAYMGGYCPACDNANTLGWTKDGGATWTNGKEQYPGFAGALLAIADADHAWWICTSVDQPSVMYTTSDGGAHWTAAHTFDKPQPQAK